MKNLKIIALVFVSIFLFSCQKGNWSLDEKPEILTAQYKTVTNGEFERGYEIKLELNSLPNNFEIKELILNKKVFEIRDIDISKSEIVKVEGYFPVHSRLIQNFIPPKPDNRSDGIIFEINGKEYFYEIKFKLN